MTTSRRWAIAYLLVFGFMIFLNYWSTTNVGTVANNNQAIIQPAGFAFSIWGLIYVLLLAWILKQLFTSGRKETVVSQLTFWPILNFLLNGCWIIVFTQQWLVTSTLVIAALLYTLGVMYTLTAKAGYRGFDRLPFSIYFAWVTVATIVNVFTVMVSAQVTTLLGLQELGWTLILLGAATGIGVLIAARFRDWLYPLVLLWPYYGIYAANDRAYASLDLTLLLTSILLVFVALIVGIYQLRLQQRTSHPQSL
ncbi:tryptophan-rich sensory protein [Marinococcus halophilus]|uniref:Tryptophan-rich sensory protein n=1 Tax=Marinococcus halophilus TaxID=1371 RepID=A0A510YBT0_MARHA|nr:tryptophan-rich sensory protein [Marinococcus halophilus]OZT79158.1 tryptophan-rich sensory protein [Marinococcus halophilus]GEK59817.1 hypothetical protein MHA01_27220 [Marinococcus halophilus]